MSVWRRIPPLALLALALAPAPAPIRAEGAREPGPLAPAARAEDWQRLRIGMTAFEVFRILGAPGRVTQYYGFTRWEYPDALGRRLNFDERGRLIAWGRQAR